MKKYEAKEDRASSVLDLLVEAIPALRKADADLMQPVTDFCRACIRVGRARDINPTVVIAWAVAKSIVAIRSNDDVNEIIDIACAMVLYQVRDLEQGGSVSVKVKENPDPKDVS